MHRNFRLTFLVGMLWVGAAWTSATAAPGDRDVTFISTSDSHYRAFTQEEHNLRNRETIEEMNRVTQLEWPTQLGGGRIGAPRGVVVLGDCIDDGDQQFRASDGKVYNKSAKQYGFFIKDFGLDGSDGFLKYPVFETWGNHDGPPIGREKHFSFQSNLKHRNQLRKEKGLVSRISANGLHYSWDWDDVHFVQLGLYPADRQREGVKYSPVWHDPQNALSFLVEDLRTCVADGGRPVVLMAHMGFDTNWWVKADWEEFYETIKPYNVILYLFGHSATGVGQYAPASGMKPLQWINDGQTEKCFFVINISSETLRFAARQKNFVPVADENGRPSRKWDGTWKWALERSLKCGR